MYFVHKQENQFQNSPKSYASELKSLASVILSSQTLSYSMDNDFIGTEHSPILPFTNSHQKTTLYSSIRFKL